MSVLPSFLLLLLALIFAASTIAPSLAEKPSKYPHPIKGKPPGKRFPPLETEGDDSTVEADLHHYKKKPYHHPRYPPQEEERVDDNTVTVDAHYKKSKPGHYKKPPKVDDNTVEADAHYKKSKPGYKKPPVEV